MIIEKYSLLMSLYKNENPEYLDECLKSLSFQTVLPDETVLVYDGPITKDLECIVEKWREKLNIKVVKLSVNKGLGVALNIGLENCSFEFIARADTDDIYPENRIEEQLSFMAKHPDCVLVGANGVEFEKYVGDLERVKVTPETKEEIRKFIKMRNPFNHMVVMYKKSFVQSIGGYDHHLFMEDYNLWVRMFMNNNNMYNIQKNLVNIRIGGNNEMVKRRKGWGYIKSEYKMFELIYKNKINSFFPAMAVFLSRVTLRVLPVSLLSKIYSISRSKN